MSQAGGPPAGWYQDPSQPGVERWWDGQAWSSQTRAPGGQSPPPPPGFWSAAVQPAAGRLSEAGERRRSGCFGIATGVMLGIIGAVVVLIGGCTALLVAASGGGEETVSVPTSTRDTADTTAEASSGGTSEENADSADESSLSEADDVVSCVRIDSETIELEVVNNSPKTSSYIMTVGFFDDAGQRLADETSFLNYLRPGERAIEQQFVFEEQGAACEVIDLDRFAAESIAGELAEVSECEVGAPDAFGDFQASVSATNGTPETSTYSVDVAFVDPEGVRRGSGSTFIEAVRPGETAPADIFTTVAHADGYSCEVVAVIRNATG